MQIFKEESISEIVSDDFEHYVDHKKQVSNLGYRSSKMYESDKSPSNFEKVMLKSIKLKNLENGSP